MGTDEFLLTAINDANGDHKVVAHHRFDIPLDPPNSESLEFNFLINKETFKVKVFSTHSASSKLPDRAWSLDLYAPKKLKPLGLGGTVVIPFGFFCGVTLPIRELNGLTLYFARKKTKNLTPERSCEKAFGFLISVKN